MPNGTLLSFHLWLNKTQSAAERKYSLCKKSATTGNPNNTSWTYTIYVVNVRCMVQKGVAHTITHKVLCGSPRTYVELVRPYPHRYQRFETFKGSILSEENTVSLRPKENMVPRANGASTLPTHRIKERLYLQVS